MSLVGQPPNGRLEGELSSSAARFSWGMVVGGGGGTSLTYHQLMGVSVWRTVGGHQW